jgi:hypothetical protein
MIIPSNINLLGPDDGGSAAATSRYISTSATDVPRRVSIFGFLLRLPRVVPTVLIPYLLIKYSAGPHF